MSKKTPIVVIEDDKFIRENLKMFLELEGYTTMVASNGREGLELIRKVAGLCVVLLDLQMPVMTGEQLLEALRHEPPAIRDVPVIVLTARSEPLYIPVAAFLSKPVDLETLLTVIAQNCA